MLRKMLEEDGIEMSDLEFKETMEAATEDIKFNRIHFKKRTSLKEILSITKICYNIVKEENFFKC